MTTLTIRIPDDTAARLRDMAKHRGISLNKLMEEDISFGTNSWRGDQYEFALRPEMWPDAEDVTDE